MITLETGDLIEGDATSASKVNYHISGSRYVSGGWKRFAETGQLAATKGTLVTCKPGETIEIDGVRCVNTDTSDRGINIYLKTDGTNSREIINDLTLVANGGSCNLTNG